MGQRVWDMYSISEGIDVSGKSVERIKSRNRG